MYSAVIGQRALVAVAARREDAVDRLSSAGAPTASVEPSADSAPLLPNLSRRPLFGALMKASTSQPPSERR